MKLFYTILFLIFLELIITKKKPIKKPPKNKTKSKGKPKGKPKPKPKSKTKLKPKSKPKIKGIEKELEKLFKETEKNEKNEKIPSKYDNLLKWGLNNSLNISKPLKFNKNNQFAAEKFITIDDIIMDIPPNVMLNINSSLSLLNSKKMRKAYNLYVEEDKKSRKKNQTIEDEDHIDQSFLSYILYLVTHKPKHYEKTEFYKYYQHIFYMFENNLDHLPFFFSSEQMRLFSNTTFGNVFESLNRYLSDEASIFEKVIYKKPIIFEDYLKYRIFSVQKYYNVSGVVNIVPFIDLIRQDHKEPNCIYYVENGHIKIRAILNVFPNEELILKPDNISNQHRLIFFGETFDEIIDQFPSYNIPIVARNFLKEQNIEISDTAKQLIEKLGITNIDLAIPEFYKYVVDIYTELSKKNKKKEKSEIDGYRLFLKYLKKFRSNLNLIDDDMIREAFYSRIDVQNAKRIFQGERMFMDKKIDDLKNYLKKFRKFKKMLDKNSKDGIVDISDLSEL